MKKTLTLFKRVFNTPFEINFKFSNPFLHQVIIGQMLGDGNITRRSPTGNSYFRLGFGRLYETYRKWLARIFGELTNKGLTSREEKKSDRTYTRYDLVTMTLGIFNYYHDLFYVYNTELGKYIKIVPVNIIELITPVVLAHLLMGDGTYNISNKIVKICTHSFTHKDCLLLARSINQLGLKTTVTKDRVGKDGNNQYYIAISGKTNLELLRSLVVPYMHKSMLYRLGIKPTIPGNVI